MIINNIKLSRDSGFTIVELLIVIVIIGILAAITIISYTGLAKKATESVLKSDLANASKKLQLYFVDHGVYPQDLDGSGCPTIPLDNNYCIKSSPNNIFDYTATTPYSDYTLTAEKGESKYKILGSNTVPVQVIIIPITSIAAITGTTQIGQTLTAGAITPGGATVSYQWQSATTSGGAYSNIPGATSSTYVVSPNVMGKYIKVAVTGTGSYGSSQTSTATTQIPVDNTNWLTIGNQTWARANLNVGIRIAGASAQTNNATTEKYCYNDAESNCTTYGGLYQWDEAMKYITTESSQGICPAGTHIPSDNEWKILEAQLGMTQAQVDTPSGWRGTDQGTQLKSGGSSGLNIPLTGSRNIYGSFYNLSLDVYVWSSSESSGNAQLRYLSTGNAAVSRDVQPKASGLSIRCLGN